MDINMDCLVMFCVLMENGEGIVGKSPDYIKEKLKLAQQLEPQMLIQILDMSNQAKYNTWKNRWG